MSEYIWGHDRRFNAYSNYFKKQFGGRVQKVAINAGFTCPNRDGEVGYGGCTYCNNEAFNPSYCQPEKSVTQQINEGKEFHATRYKNAGKYLAYFQAFSNTYGKLEDLKRIYDEALSVDGVIGLVIGTRPDCIDDEKLDYFQKLAETNYVILEYGIESCYNRTLEAINRGHTFEKAVEAIEETAQRGIKTGAHIIFGLPGESKEEMMNEAAILSKLPLNNIKFHQLQIFKDTIMGEQYLENPDMFKLFSLEEYVEFIVDFIEYLNPNIVIERFAGESPPRFILSNSWGLRNDQVLNLIEQRLKDKDTWQGKLYKG